MKCKDIARIKSGDLVLHCTQCNQQLETAKIGGRDEPFCARCCRVEYGYCDHEGIFVKALQRAYPRSTIRIENILQLVQESVGYLAQCKRCSLETLGRVMCDPDDPENWD